MTLELTPVIKKEFFRELLEKISKSSLFLLKILQKTIDHLVTL